MILNHMWMVLPILLCGALKDTNGAIVTRPTNIAAVQGQDVTVTCETDGQYNTQFLTESHIGIQSKKKYVITTSDNIFNLTIKNISLADAKRYYCASGDHVYFGILVFESTPECEVNTPISAPIDAATVIRISCQAEYRPPDQDACWRPSIEWTRTDEHGEVATIASDSDTNENSMIYSLHSSTVVTPSHGDIFHSKMYFPRPQCNYINEKGDNTYSVNEAAYFEHKWTTPEINVKGGSTKSTLEPCPVVTVPKDVLLHSTTEAADQTHTVAVINGGSFGGSSPDYLVVIAMALGVALFMLLISCQVICVCWMKERKLVKKLKKKIAHGVYITPPPLTSKGVIGGEHQGSSLPVHYEELGPAPAPPLPPDHPNGPLPDQPRFVRSISDHYVEPHTGMSALESTQSVSQTGQYATALP